MRHSLNTSTAIARQIATQSLCEEIVKFRKLRGLKQKDLAQKLKITPARLCKIEKGRHLPGLKTLVVLEHELDMPRTALQNIRDGIRHAPQFSGPYVRLDERLVPVHYDHTIPEAKLQLLREVICPQADEYAELDRKIKIPSNCKVNLVSMKATSADDGTKAAACLRNALGEMSASFIALLPMLERANFRLVPVDDLPPVIAKDGIQKRRDAFAFHDRLYGNAIICINRQSPPYSQLYDIAYEVGAYLRYRHFANAGTTPRRNESWFCRAFATDLLLPDNEIRDIIDELNIGNDDWSLRLLDDLALRFGVSSRAFIHRLHGMRRIDKDIFQDLDVRLQDPATFIRADTFSPRAPLVFGTWLKTLRLRASIAR